jgi:hypothetical protein
MRRAWIAAGVLGAMALAGCDRGASTGATSNPNAPGSPGQGNETRTVTPTRGDTPPGGSSGAVGTASFPDSSGGDAVPGLTGSGSATPGSSVTQPGLGTTGGLGASGGVAGPPPEPQAGDAAATRGPVPAGTTNR